VAVVGLEFMPTQIMAQVPAVVVDLHQEILEQKAGPVAEAKAILVGQGLQMHKVTMLAVVVVVLDRQVQEHLIIRPDPVVAEYMFH
jgi:hypothetical protein